MNEFEYYFDKHLSKHPQKSLFNYVKDSIKSGGYFKNPNPIQPLIPLIDTDENNCVKPASRPSMTQFIFRELVGGIATNKLLKKGFIGWLSTGAGKTIVSASIIDQFWNTDKTVYYISRHDALKPPEEFLKFLHKIWKRNDINIKSLNKKFKIMSIASFSNRIKSNDINTSKSVVIIDEAQYLFANRAVQTLKSQHNYLIKYLVKKNDNMNVFILTATPGDNINELTILLNIVNSKKRFITKNNYKDNVNDKILYLDMYRDTSIFPEIKGMFENIIENNLDNKQILKYIEKVHELSSSPKLKMYQTLQKWSNSLYTTNNHISNKLKSVMNTIQKYPNDKHYIYSQYFKQGLQEFIQLVENNGYSLVSKANMNKKSMKYILAKASEGFVASDEKNKFLKLFNSEENKNGDYIQLFLATDSYNTGIDLKAVKHIHFLEPTIEFLDTIQGVGRGARYCSHKHLDKKEWTVQVHHYISKLNADIPKIVKQFHTSKYKFPDRHIDKINKKVESDLKFIDIITSVDQIIFDKIKNEYIKYHKTLNPLRSNAIDCQVMINFHNNNIPKDSPFYLVCNEGNVKKGVHIGKPNPILFTEQNIKNLQFRIQQEKEQRNKIIQESKNKLNMYTKKLSNASSFAKELKEFKIKFNQDEGIRKIQNIKYKQNKKYASIVKFAKQLALKKQEMNSTISKVKEILDGRKSKYERAVAFAKEIKSKKQLLDFEKGLKILQKQFKNQMIRYKKAVKRAKMTVLISKELEHRQEKVKKQQEFIKKMQEQEDYKKKLENERKKRQAKNKEKVLDRQLQLKMLQQGKLSKLYFKTEDIPCNKLVYRYKGPKSRIFNHEKKFTKTLCEQRDYCQTISKHPYCINKKIQPSMDIM